MGLLDLTTQTTTTALNSFLQHYGTESNLGVTLTAAIENMQLEPGVHDCPLNYDYNTWGMLATDS